MTRISADFAASATLGRGSISFLGARRHPVGDFLGRERVLNVEDADSGNVVGGENHLLALKRTGPIFVQVVRAEGSETAEVPLLGRRQSGNGHGVFLGPQIHDERTKLALGALFGIRFVGHDGQLSARQGKRSVRATGKGRTPVDVRNQLGLGRVAEIMDGEATIAPGSVAAIARGNHVMQGNAAARRQSRRLAGRAIHAGHPPAPHNFGLGDVLQVDHAEKVIGEAVKMRGDRGVAPAGPPQAIDAQARHFEKGDFPHLGGTGNIVNAQARPEFLAVGNAIGQRIFEITADVVVRLHGDDIRAVGEQQQVAGNLQVMGAGRVSAGEEADGLELARIGRIQNRHSVAEHVADIKMPAVEHDLNAIRAPADIAVGEMTEVLSDALRRNCRFLRVGLRGSRRQRRETQQAFPAIAPSDRHVVLRFLNSAYTASSRSRWSDWREINLRRPSEPLR